VRVPFASRSRDLDLPLICLTGIVGLSDDSNVSRTPPKPLDAGERREGDLDRPDAASSCPAVACEVDHGGVSLHLLPERAALVPETGTLLVADLHLDKPAAYRREGVAMPEGILEESLVRLASLASRPEVREILVLGDLLHHRHGADRETADRFARWRREHPLRMALVGGNHDRAAGRHLEAWSIEDAGARYRLGNLELVHDPRSASRPPAVAGHLHPVASIARGPRRFKLPAFVVTREVVVLPAFTAFASGERVAPEVGDRVYAIAEGRVVEVTRALSR